MVTCTYTSTVNSWGAEIHFLKFFPIRLDWKEKTTVYFLKFLFLFGSTVFPELMENEFIQMAALSEHEVAYTIGPIF